jgi:Tol biopolymer transport system component
MLHNRLLPAMILLMIVAAIITGCNGESTPNLGTKIAAVSPPKSTHTSIPSLSGPPATITPTSTPTILFTGKIAFISERQDRSELYLMGADGSNQKPLTSINIDPISDKYLWSPDGEKIAYITSLMSPSGDARLWVINKDGTNPIQLSKQSQGRYLTDSVDWSPDSQQLVYSAGPNVYRINANGGGLTRLVYDSSKGADDWSYSLVHWLRDGRIAVVTQNQDVRRIYAMNSDGSNKQEVDFSVFLREVERVEITKNKITVMDSIGSERFHLDVDLGFVQDRINSPDGTKIAFASDNGGDFEIYVFDITKLKLNQLTNNTTWDDDPAWSPDGERIVFESNRTGNSEIYIMNFDGTRQTRLTFNSGSDESPAWQP